MIDLAGRFEADTLIDRFLGIGLYPVATRAGGAIQLAGFRVWAPFVYQSPRLANNESMPVY